MDSVGQHKSARPSSQLGLYKSFIKSQLEENGSHVHTTEKGEKPLCLNLTLKQVLGNFSRG